MDIERNQYLVYIFPPDVILDKMCETWQLITRIFEIIFMKNVFTK